MARQVKDASEVLAEQPVPVVEVAPETVAPVVEVAETPIAPPAELPLDTPEPTPVAEKKPCLRIQINQIQNIVFPDRSEYLATHGIHEIQDPELAAKIKAYAKGGKRQIFILEE